VLPGLGFRETLAGSYWRLDAPRDVRPIAVALEAHAPDMAMLVRDRAFRLEGTLDARDLASAQPARGTLAFRFVQQGRLHYRLAFTGDDGCRYELGGQKEWSALAPLESLSVLAASIYDSSGIELAHATLRFDAPAPRAGVWSIVKSLRIGSHG
jgi:hypothetical protein